MLSVLAILMGLAGATPVAGLGGTTQALIDYFTRAATSAQTRTVSNTPGALPRLR